MRSILVYDLPTRIFHWLFSTLFLVSFIIAKTGNEDSLLFSYHMLSGLLLVSLILWRIFWGFFGSKHAKFTDFKLNPIDLKNYLMGILLGSKKRWSGHNPASSWAAITMFALGLGLGVTGYLMATGRTEAFEEIHEILANAFIVVVVCHVAGVILHSIRHRDAVAFSMLDGKKDLKETRDPIPSSKPFAGLLLLALVIAGGISLYKNFDSQNRTLQLFGQTLLLGENESGEMEESGDD